MSRPPLPLQAEPSCGAGLPAHRSCHLRPPWRLPCLSSPVLVEFRGEGSRCLLSLSALVLPAVWMVLPSPAPYLWGPLVCLFLLVVFIYIYIKASDPAPTHPHPHTAVNLSVVKNAVALLPASASALSLIKRGGPPYSHPRLSLFYGRTQRWIGQ